MDPTLLDALTIMLAQALPHLVSAGGKADRAQEESDRSLRTETESLRHHTSGRVIGKEDRLRIRLHECEGSLLSEAQAEGSHERLNLWSH